MLRFKLVLALGLLLPALAFAVPIQVPYSGQLSEGGLLVTGSRTISFSIYADSTGGAPLYTQAELLAILNGVYHTNINAPQTVWDGSTRWLGVTVAGGAELAPRTRIGSAPYSAHANVADSLSNSPRSWQEVFAGPFFAPCCGVWTDVGPELQITTSGGPLLIVVDVYSYGGASVTFQPVVDGVWAGSYSGMWSASGDIYWKEGIQYDIPGGWQQWNKSKIYPGIPAGTHTVRIQASTDGGTAQVGATSVPCALEIVELLR